MISELCTTEVGLDKISPDVTDEERVAAEHKFREVRGPASFRSLFTQNFLVGAVRV